MRFERALATAPRGVVVAVIGVWTVGLHVVQLVTVALTHTPGSRAPAVASLLAWVAITAWALLPGRRMNRAEAALALSAGSVAVTAYALASDTPGLAHLVSVGLFGYVLGVGTLSAGRWALAADLVILCCQALAIRAATAPGPFGVIVVVAAVVTTAVTCTAVWSMQRSLRATVASSRKAALHDPLTGLLNRRGMEERFPELLGAAGAGHRPAAVVLDLDRFKRINDLHGHDAGDLVLTLVADLLRARAREGDLVVRLGGEELAWLGTWPSLEAATTAAEELRRRTAMCSAQAGTTVTTSIGVAFATAATLAAPADEALSRLLVRADKALYEAKRRGRDQVVAASADTAPPTNGTDPAPRERDGVRAVPQRS
ncbi:GGDEF domain-containing protein [Streptomyces sp. NP160]|uniref:GGDEF domain-containing protein n=1 Tax=Streptomyces sp. NP160 TaxID=2586637 RepID=UPI00111B1471|nr:GGDEF domain-containing protein [Streptomyces sp. NP160]TNM64487.1 GGDEF domain-containing protein [Streptomyces sp. NP160]